MSFSKIISNPNRVMDRLEREGFAEKLERGTWLIPSQERPSFDTPRFWSNPDLSDPLTISALVVRNPTARDVARMVLAYGSRPAEKAMAEMVAEGRMSSAAVDRARRMINNAKVGLANAANRRAA
ncbi:hypothetical protein [Devosia sp. A369]